MKIPKKPVANSSKEAIALRGAAIAFVKNIDKPVLDINDTISNRLNTALLKAAVDYARVAGQQTISEAHLKQLLKACDNILEAVLDYYHRDSGDLGSWNEIIWEFLRAVCKARSIKLPKLIPDYWPEQLEDK